MPAVHVKGQMGTGHGCYAPRANTQGSADVFVNGVGVHRVGDSWSTHACGVCPPHAGTLQSGSTTVFANGKGVARIGDSVDCGSAVAEGSSDVFAG